ncbi:hypothetical protein R50073_47930 [Maricurvus nonylphenolicus]|uniref:OmpA family protein n=1 Tax=Maricurvus nonylphenolicus TaxID=1008307 RepID=UPI0036F4119C
MKLTAKTLGVLGLAALLSAPTLADDHKYEISGAMGRYFIDSDRDLEDDDVPALGLGYVINPQWTVEAWWLDIDTDDDRTGEDVDGTQYRIDGLYHFNEANGWRPFLAFGLGEMDFDYDNSNDSEETQLNFGVGLKREIHPNWSVRADLRAFHSLDEEDTDYAAMLGMTFQFGGSPAAPAGPLDSDGDGVTDDMDACPNTPAGVTVDAKGCPLDSDGDGVYDYMDKCPDTAPNLKVDADGCPIKLEKAVSIELKVNFDNNSDVVKPEYFDEIKRVADFANQYKDTVVEVQGHTDSRGSAAYNKNLSDRRAKAVAKVLVETYGMGADRVTAKGYGEEQPTATNDTAEGRAANRRVVAEISAVETTMQTK